MNLSLHLSLSLSLSLSLLSFRSFSRFQACSIRWDLLYLWDYRTDTSLQTKHHSSGQVITHTHTHSYCMHLQFSLVPWQQCIIFREGSRTISFVVLQIRQLLALHGLLTRSRGVLVFGKIHLGRMCHWWSSPGTRMRGLCVLTNCVCTIRILSLLVD